MYLDGYWSSRWLSLMLIRPLTTRRPLPAFLAENLRGPFLRELTNFAHWRWWRSPFRGNHGDSWHMLTCMVIEHGDWPIEDGDFPQALRWPEANVFLRKYLQSFLGTSQPSLLHPLHDAGRSSSKFSPASAKFPARPTFRRGAVLIGWSACQPQHRSKKSQVTQLSISLW